MRACGQKQTDEIRVDADGFEIWSAGGNCDHVDWSAIRGIAGLKVDLFSVDCITLAFRDSEAMAYKYAFESMAGYDLLVAEVERRFANRDPEWWSKTAFPPFATCWTVVWGDAPEPADCPACGGDITGVAADRCPACQAALDTRVCPMCRGSGHLGARLRPRVMLAVSGIAFGLAALGLSGLFPAAAGKSVTFLGVALACVYPLCLIVDRFLRRMPCTVCESTGWWDPRGRAFRKARRSP